MSDTTPTVVLVHGAFAESASWNGVIERPARPRHHVDVAVANPLRSLGGDAAYVRDVVAASAAPVLLVGHSYGGMVITQAAAGNQAVVGLVYVDAFAPGHRRERVPALDQLPGQHPRPGHSTPIPWPTAATSSRSAATSSTTSSRPTCPPSRRRSWGRRSGP